MTNWYQRRFGSVLDPETEVLPLLGSAEGLFHIHSCLLDPGDVALVPDPAYPAYAAGVAIAGGVAVKVPLLKENGFLPDLAAIPQDVARQAKMIWVNYPNNPTSADADLGFYQQLVEWARRYEVAVIADNPYSEICFDDFCPPSFLMADGAREVGIEFNSLSKAYNCCGWRIGMALGNGRSSPPWPRSSPTPTAVFTIPFKWRRRQRSTARSISWKAGTRCSPKDETWWWTP